MPVPNRILQLEDLRSARTLICYFDDTSNLNLRMALIRLLEDGQRERKIATRYFDPRVSGSIKEDSFTERCV